MISTIDRVFTKTLPFWNELKHSPQFRKLCGFEETIWTRKAQDEETGKLVRELDPSKLDVLEISGTVWRSFGFKSYKSVSYPEFDLCKDRLDEKFDLVIAAHLFEHLLYPYRGGQNVAAMVKPGGHFLCVVPFLYRVHPCPYDCTRWTETGLKYFLAECGFKLDDSQTGSWGNRAVVSRTWRTEFQLFNRHWHTMRNEPQYPLVVWCLAKK